ncbi:type I-F CRISPR-associated protein Csy3 [Hafnia alvei]|uniref:type I-F CRISPR-associated protein Csy3 n=1 Tax=Hafnia alvei TaxID=569 RepID=UPI0028BDB763|nr:type I-F CRISPR-associated protein Csy3 [Hafnia alvei]WNN51139.1 type I-F CRISPR-associated protein Csy3 [Hafnia alvei]
MAKTSVIKTASVLAFERKLANSDAVMFSGNWQGNVWQPIQVREKAVRGTMSHRQKNPSVGDPAKLDKDPKNANLQLVDIAALPMDADTLKMTFTLRVLGNLAEPSVCNEKPYLDALREVIEGYVGEYGFGELALRYATNLANGRFLWRNRIGAEHIKVVVKGSKTWTFDAHDFSLRSFDKRESDIQELAAEIEKGLKGNTFVRLEVVAFVCLGRGQEVFPSQELIQDRENSKGNDSKDSNSKKYKKSKVLYQVDGVAALHSQKIGNALRTIDTWHSNVDELGVIAVEPYGAVTNRFIVCREPKDKIDFYTLLDNWLVKKDKPTPEQQHYVMAVLIRGGVFGGKSE